LEYAFYGLEPQSVLRNFWELSQVYSRRADNTQGISDYLAGFGKKLGLEVFQDETTNVIIYKPATPGYECAPTVMLTGHMDMICATAPGVVHDFDNEPLELILDADRDTIRANGTTLGADCGLGLAFILAVLESDQIRHPAIEAVFTTNEETDMKGAWNLHYEKLNSKLILSLDATRLSMGGAGELDLELLLPRNMIAADADQIQATIEIGGLIGGHSGKNAFAERGNANALLVRVLSDLQKEKNIPFRIVSFAGGDYTACAFAREAACTLQFPVEYAKAVEGTVAEWQEILKHELAVPDPNVFLRYRVETVVAGQVCDDETTERFLSLMTILPDGLCSLHKYFKEKYESCVNLGVVTPVENAFRILVCIRAAVASKKYFLFDKVRRICDLLGTNYRIMNDLPQWEYNDRARLPEVIGDIYADIEPNVAQGTCEQGIFLMHMQGAEAAGVGPVVQNPHSPNECISVKAAAEDWDRFVRVLQALKNY